MEALKIVLLLIAYTLAVATLTIQILAYKKDIEYRETIWLTMTFLLAIISLTISEFTPSANKLLVLGQHILSNAAIVLLAVAVAVNIHKERVMRNRLRRNLVLLLTGSVSLIVSLSFLIYQRAVIAYLSTSIFLFVSVFYAMFAILFTAPTALLKSYDKQEKRNAKVVLVIMSLSLAIFWLVPSDQLLQTIEQRGAYILAIISILLTATKLPHDIKRLMTFSQPQSLPKDHLQQFNISPREQEVLALLLKGHTNKEIAEALFISLPTVKTHVSNIYKKMQVRNRLELLNLIKK